MVKIHHHLTKKRVSFYCDVCNSLEKLKHDPSVSKDQLGRQFSDLTCPSKAGVYSFSREFCFNDFREFDKDNDCQFDFLQEDGLAKTYKDALKNLQQVGYGTVTAKFTLSTNATDDQEKQKFNKEQEIERDIERDLTKRRLENGWDVDNEQYLVFKRWFTQLRKDQWHKQEYLPWLLYYNRVGCLSVSFNVCDKEPTPLSRGQTWQCVLLATSRSISFGEHRCDYPEIYGTSHFKMNDAFTPEKYCKRGAGGQAPGEHAVRSLCHAIAQPEDCGFDLANWYGIGEDIWRRCQNEPQTLKWRMPIATMEIGQLLLIDVNFIRIETLCIIAGECLKAAVNKQDVRQENSTKCRNFKILSETHFLTQIRLRTLQIKINIEARRNENCLRLRK
uniref:DUF7753 domain-containing protein n=1 Tax=Romanomermis culicivorax TaxID=13658 RepID=A0A915K6B8_ROMCU